MTVEMTTESIAQWAEEALRSRLSESACAWLEKSAHELRAGVDANRFCALFSSASRHARAVSAKLTLAEFAAAGELVPGWNPERWSLRVLLRASLLLSLGGLESEAGARIIEEAFRYADEGEACALYASLCLLPDAGRFRKRSEEGCRTNMLSVFEANVCDTPYPSIHFDDVAWNQCLIKCVFVGAPLWRVVGLDGRLSPELARMALDLVEERASAGRPIQPDLWLCLGAHEDERVVRYLTRELASGSPAGRAAAGYALARANLGHLLEPFREKEADPRILRHFENALSGRHSQNLFGELDSAP